jgi:membrane-bound serine protease (ClpP class)
VVFFFALGIVMLAMEVFAPGFILGLCGGLAMLTGCVLAFARLGMLQGTLAVSVGFLVLAVFLYAELVLLPKSRVGRKFFLPPGSLAKRSQPPVAERSDVVGRICSAVTVLSPSGYVDLDGRRYEAFSQSGYAATGQQLRVVDLDNFRLIVTKT